MKTNILILRHTHSGLYYNQNLGGFVQADPEKATTLDNEAQAEFIKAHFQHPEFIETVPAPALKALPGETVGDLIRRTQEREYIKPESLRPVCITQCNAVGGGKTFALQMVNEAVPAPFEMKATRADTLAEIGKALSEVIFSSGPGAVSAKLSTIRKAIEDVEALTRKEQDKAHAAAASLMDAEETVIGLIDYICIEEHPPRDLFEVLLMIKDGIQGASISEADEPEPSVIPTDDGACLLITNEGEPAPESEPDPTGLRSIGHEAYLDWHRWHHYHDAYAGTPQRQNPDDNCKLCGEWDHDTEECEHQYY